MKKALIVIVALIIASGLAGCNRSSASAAPNAAAPAGAEAAASPAAAAAAATNDKVSQKLQELAGKSATNCGRLGLTDNLQAASDCALQANKAKKPFYVAYDMPGLTVGVAGAGNGKLYAVQAESGARGAAPVTATDCPAALRVAQSGRVTCVPPGSMGIANGASSPHAGMTMPPADKGNPHGGMPMPPPGTPNPHQGGIPIEGAKSH